MDSRKAQQLIDQLLRLARDPAAYDGEKRNALDRAKHLAEKFGLRYDFPDHAATAHRYGFDPDHMRETIRRAEEQARRRSSAYDTCDQCGTPMFTTRSHTARVYRYAEPTDPGRERHYCSNACRQRAYRVRSRRT